MCVGGLPPTACFYLTLTQTFRLNNDRSLRSVRHFRMEESVRVATQYASVRRLREFGIYSPGGKFSDVFAIYDISEKLSIEFLTVNVVSKSHVTSASSVAHLIFPGLSLLDLGRCTGLREVIVTSHVGRHTEAAINVTETVTVCRYYYYYYYYYFH